MTRHDAIAAINARLADADDETVEAVAEFVRSLDEPRPVRPLSERERSLLEQSRADFKAGRTYTMEESRARTDAMLAKYRTPKPAP